MENLEKTRGRFITFEGLEGSGKSTHVAELSKKLIEAGKEVLVLREPGGRELCEKIRMLLKHEKADPPTVRAELLLFLAARAQLVEKTIKPALESGKWVVCDRFSDSTIAYQAFGRGLGKEEVVRMDSFATAGLKPDMTVYLDVSVSESFQRIKARAEATGRELDRIEKTGEEFFEKVLNGFTAIAMAEGTSRFVVVESSKSRERVAAEIWSKMEEKFGKELSGERA